MSLPAAARLCLLLLTLAPIAPSTLAAEGDDPGDFQGLAEEMSAAEFFKAGLDKLTPEQLAALNAWLKARVAATDTVPLDGEVMQSDAEDVQPDADAMQPVEEEASAAQTSAPATTAPSAAAAAEAEEAARQAEAEAAAAIAAAEAAEAEARERAAEAQARQAAAEQAAVEDAQLARRLAEEEALREEPFRDGRWVGPKPDRVEARIDGAFEGWRGETLFSLDNGQVWRQRQRGSYFHSAASPEIVITRNMLGFFVLEVVPTGKKIGVTRVR